jgi:hypothetical protein
MTANPGEGVSSARPHDDALWRLTPVERLELVAFDLELRWGPRALIAAVWLAVDTLRRHRDQTVPTQASTRDHSRLRRAAKGQGNSL